MRRPGFVALGAGTGSGPVSAGLDGSSHAEEWRLEAGRTSVVLSPLGEAVAAIPETGVGGFDQLCRVRGRLVVDEAEHSVDCLGSRGARDETVAGDRFESIREVAAWFAPGDGLVLAALRPRNSPGHDRDVVTAAVLGGQAVTVSDPRLSTAYTSEGRPARAGLELWLAEGDGGASGEDDGQEQQYPRRASGEAVGARAELSSDALEVQAELFRWHSRGLEGAGVYLLARLP